MTFEQRLTDRDREFLKCVWIEPPPPDAADDLNPSMNSEAYLIIARTFGIASKAAVDWGIQDSAHWKFVRDARDLVLSITENVKVVIITGAQERYDWPTLEWAITLRGYNVIEIPEAA
jgi:hypothetical protein